MMTPIWTTILLVFLAALVLAGLSRFDRRSRSVLRLDWFLPQLRRLREGEQLNSRVAGRWLLAIVPKSFRSNRVTKRRGAVRRGLRKLGISWLASPPRRVVQAMCLVLFLTLFFYVCWPYDAKPVTANVLLNSITFASVDQSTGTFTFSMDEDRDARKFVENRIGNVGKMIVVDRSAIQRSDRGAISDSPSAMHPKLLNEGEVVFLSVANGIAHDETPVSYRCEITEIGDRLTLIPLEAAADELFDEVLVGSKIWNVYDRAPDAWPSHYADNLASKERMPAETFLIIDPLVAISTSLATRSWVWSLVFAGVILLVCVLIPRGFCGYLCPLGTTIDLFDWAITSRTKRFQVPADGWWVHIKYYLLAGTLVAAVCGVLLTGFVSAIPVLTRGLLFIMDPLQSGVSRGMHLIPSMNSGHLVSIAMFVGVLCLGFLRPRFWCKYACPSGAVFSLGNLFRATERKVESSCIHCNKCVEICPFDAIKPDFTTRETDCTMCQSCAGVCPTHAIKFVERWNVVELKAVNDPPTGETSLGRRGFLSLTAGSTSAVVGGVVAAGGVRLWGANLDDEDSVRPVRPPGSVPEQDFLEQCIRCGECFKACPNNVLQPVGFEQGLEGLWTPEVIADWAGCESSCNACGQVCPTGAIRALPLAEKKVARIGLAIVNESTCLPFAGREDCDLCVQECKAAGYHAIEYMQVGTQMDAEGRPIEGTGMLAPVVRADDCVGCGLCQTRCYTINVKDKGLLSSSAIVIEAGEGKEVRLRTGSYLALREERAAASQSRRSPSNAAEVDPMLFQITEPPLDPLDDENPFGL